MPSSRETYRKTLRSRVSQEKAAQLAYRTSSGKAIQMAKRMKESGKA